jgi:hypothetical protein
MFGLSTNPILIAQLVTDPARNPAAEPWGTPLTLTESQDMENRVSAARAMKPIDDYGNGPAASDYSGTYIDQQNGGLVYVGFTANAASHLSDLAVLYAYPALLRTFTATYTLDYLNSLADRIIADAADLSAAGVSVTGVGPSIETNRVLVRASNASPVTAQILTSRYGGAVEQELGDAGKDQGRINAAIPPVHGGEQIYGRGGMSTASCSSGFSATRLVNHRLRYYLITAGHCREDERGRVTRRHWYHNHRSVGTLEFSRVSGNADVAFLRVPQPMTSYGVLGNFVKAENSNRFVPMDGRDDYPRNSRPKAPQTHAHEPMCLSGYRWRNVRCGVVTRPDWSPPGGIHHLVRASLSSLACSGDSGGAWYMPSGSRDHPRGAAIGVHEGVLDPVELRQGDFCGRDAVATHIEHALNQYSGAEIISRLAQPF